jgi:hypothetical protein
MSTLVFDVRYTFKEKDGAQRHHVDKNRRMLYKSHSLGDVNAPGAFVWWEADDIDNGGFEYQVGASKTRITVKDYYAAKGVYLRYPKMPLIRTSDEEYFPFELLFQGIISLSLLLLRHIALYLTRPTTTRLLFLNLLAFDELKGAHTDAQKRDVLQFHDDHAATKLINYISFVNQNIADVEDNGVERQIWEKLSISPERTPLVMEAKGRFYSPVYVLQSAVVHLRAMLLLLFQQYFKSRL